MSPWIDRILSEFPSDLARMWVAATPTRCCWTSRYCRCCARRGFEVLPFEDSVRFARSTRNATARHGTKVRPEPRSLVLHFRSSEPNELPWDYLSRGRTVHLSLANLFPSLHTAW